VLDRLQDAGNAGSSLRSAAAFGFTQVIALKATAALWAPKVLRSAQGAHFLTTLVEDVDLPAWIADFRASGGRTLATSSDARTSLYNASLTGRLALLIGNEGSGVSADVLARVDERVAIPMAAGSQSLNAAAAAAVVLFECVRRRRAATTQASK